MQHSRARRLLPAGGPRAAELEPYILEGVPIDPETGGKITANPLMLSMVVFIFEVRPRIHASHPPSSLLGARALPRPTCGRATPTHTHRHAA